MNGRTKTGRLTVFILTIPLILFAVIFRPVPLMAQQISIPDWENPLLTTFNTIKPHSTYIPYDSEIKAINNDPALSADYKLLNGRWNFCLSENYTKVPQGFYIPEFDASKWSLIDVPSTWEVQGYSYPIYTNSAYEFCPENPQPPHVPYDYNPVGAYITRFLSPEGFKGKNVFIHFGAVKSFFYIWLNGKYIGFSKDSKTPAEFDLTPYMVQGENTLALEVFRWSDGSYLECQDMWRMSGINRDVYLYARPGIYIRDFFARGDLKDNYTNGNLVLDVLFNDLESAKAKKQSLRISLFESDNTHKQVFSEVASLSNIQGKDSLRFEKIVSQAKKWTAEL
ncbi:MAG: sugar-binding domain-containing protein [Bacteroidota bacterium]